MTAPHLFPIVAVGASAGGIEALEGLFRSMPSDTGMAFIIVTHLPPGRESLLSEVVSHFTAMPVRAVQHGDEIRPNQLYVVPADMAVTVSGGTLRARPTDATHRERNPIDSLFSSLGADRGEYAIGVVLSGGGSDGTLGVKAIKQSGGLTLAQGTDHSAPRHDSMPSNAIGSGLVDLVVAVEAMPEALANYARGLNTFGTGAARAAAPGHAERPFDDLRRDICQILRNQVGHDFSGYKENTFLRRVQRRMHVLQVSGIDGYADRLRQDPGEVTLLFRDLLIGVTSFFRDEEVFEALATQVVPMLFKGKGASDTVRVWVPGCSTGEEAYTIAILLREHMDTLRALPKVQVFATDIDETALSAARAGRYPAPLVGSVSAERRQRFFVADGGSFLLAKEVRDLCIFSAHSVIRDPPFSRVDLISCRNLLIYLGADLQRQLLPMFHYALRPGGYLLLGSSENVTQFGDLFIPIDKSNRIFARQEGIGRDLQLPLSVASGWAGRPAGRRLATTTSATGLQRLVETRVLDRFAPAHVVTTVDGDVVYYSPRTGKYLEAAAGPPSRQLFAMARRGLRLDLRNALQLAAESRRTIVRENIPVEIDDRIQVVTITIDPMVGESGDALFLVVFNDVGVPTAPDAVHVPLPVDAAAAVEHLERELRETRDRLQSTIEEYETAIEELKSANEELVSVNEELQSANEELETSKEEVQSVNEELQTVNVELNAKVEELDHANSDLHNLFESTQVAVVFLDQEMVVRSFTPAMTEIFTLIPSDRGRPISDISCHLDFTGLTRDIRTVLITKEPIERPVVRPDPEKHYLLRILPYRAKNLALDGVLIAAIDVSKLAAAEKHQRVLIAELNHRVRNMLAIVSALARQTLIRTPDPERFAESFLGRIQAMARSYGLVARDNWGDVRLRTLLLEELEPYRCDPNGDRISAQGPDVVLRSQAALALGVVFHELAANAVKYGALSVATGTLDIRWTTEGDGGQHLVIRWSESGGPPVAASSRKGFGSELIERELRYELGGVAAVEFRPQGVEATLNIPMRDTLLAVSDKAGEGTP
ncbi:MAG TPA: CheR family methyltransferase [Azospirillum sp.]|nr:CheR family methyltransferase [Azospirillum sp.]